MADAQDEELETERRQIRQSQSSKARKKEVLERVQSKVEALKEEVKERTTEVKKLQGERERATQESNAQAKGDRGNERMGEARDDFVKETVVKRMQQRVPIMDDQQEEEDGKNKPGATTRQAEGGKDEEKNKVHDTVLVFFKKDLLSAEREYKVSYRIDENITVEDLLIDTCSYWGLSPTDYELCRKTPNELGEDLPRKKILQQKTAGDDEGVLNPNEYSFLYLVQSAGGGVNKWKDMLQNAANEKQNKRQQDAKRTEDAEEETKPGPTVAEADKGQQKEFWIEPFYQWQGLKLLFEGRGGPSGHMGLIKFRDLVLYFLIAICTGFSFLARDSAGQFRFRQGPHTILISGLRSSDYQTAGFNQIKKFDDMVLFFNTSFTYQMFNAGSELRQFHKPVGFMRVKQAKAKVASCKRIKIAELTASSCYYEPFVGDGSDTQSIILPKQDQFGDYQNGYQEGRMTPGGLNGDPYIFAGPADFDASQRGMVYGEYDGSGYMQDYSLQAGNITETGYTFQRDLPNMFLKWVDHRTRMFSVEFTMHNPSLHRYINVLLIVEISGSGVVVPTPVLTTFAPTKTGAQGLAANLDMARIFLLIIGIVIMKPYVEISHKIEAEKPGWHYLASFHGILDLSTVATCFAEYYIRSSVYKPPDPTMLTHFYSFTTYANMFQNLEFIEAFFFFLICIRLVTFARVSRPVYRFCKMYVRAVRQSIYFFMLLIPVFVGSILFAHSIWSPYVYRFSTWSESFFSLVILTVGGLDMHSLNAKSRVWTPIFIIYFFIIIMCFFLNCFLAIIVYSYFEAWLISEKRTSTTVWGKDKWLDFMCFSAIYKALPFKSEEPGCSKTYSDDEIEDDEDGDESGSDEDEDDG